MGKANKTTKKGLIAKAVDTLKPKPAIKKPEPVRIRLSRTCKQARVMVKAVLACDVANLISGRPDVTLVQAHLEAIEEHRLKYQARLDTIAKQIKDGNAAQKHAIPPNKAKVTEATGEHETTLWCIQNLKDYEIRSGFAAGIGIDQIWAKKNGSGEIESYAIVEAKGPGAMLSTDAAKGDQMSTQWVKASLEQVVSSSKTSATEKADARAMLKAIASGPPPEVRGYVIEALPGGGAIQKGCPDKGIYHHVSS